MVCHRVLTHRFKPPPFIWQFAASFFKAEPIINKDKNGFFKHYNKMGEKL